MPCALSLSFVDRISLRENVKSGCRGRLGEGGMGNIAAAAADDPQVSAELADIIIDSTHTHRAYHCLQGNT
jgi:hypothetical protein